MANLDDDDRRFITALLKPLQDNYDRHEREIYGNGQPGIKENVATLLAEQGRIPVAMIFSGIAALAAVASAIVVIQHVVVIQ